MKKLVFLLLLLANIALGQKIDYNKIILPKTVQNPDLGERLVQIAWENNPQNRILEKEKIVAKQNVRLARWSWLDNVYGVFNANENNYPGKKEDKVDPNKVNIPGATSSGAPPNDFYPLYNFGFRLSLGDIVSTPIETKRAKVEYAITDENINVRKLELRALVLVNYQNYIMNKELLKMQNEIAEDATSAYSLAEKKFKDGDLSFEDFNEALQKLNTEKVQRIRSENAFMLSKIKLEEVVGIRMEDID